MPVNQSPTTIPDTIEMRIPGSAKTHRYQKHEKIGEGTFSDVYRVTDEQGNTFALKAIKLDNSHLSNNDRIALMQVIKKEVGILKKLDMLKGFKKLKDSVLILQPYYPGQVAKDRISNPLNNFVLTGSKKSQDETNQIIKECFLTLLEVHSKNIVHMDPHCGNFIYDAENKKPAMVDFGFAQKKNKYNGLEDNFQFVLKFTQIALLNGDHKLLFTLCKHYIDSVIKHINEHKVETAFKIFLYGALSIGALYGLGSYAAARMLLWAFCKTITLDFVTDWFSSVLQRNQAQLIAQKCGNGGNDETGEFFRKGIKQGHIIVAALLFWGIYRLYESPLALIEKLIAMTVENSPSSQAFWSSALNSISALEIGNAALFYYPATNAYKYLSDLFEATFSTEKSLSSDCERIASNSWLSYFNFHKTKVSESESKLETESPKTRPALV